jgi:hypothetical protein
MPFSGRSIKGHGRSGSDGRTLRFGHPLNLREPRRFAIRAFPLGVRFPPFFRICLTGGRTNFRALPMLSNRLSLFLLNRADLNQIGQVDRCPSKPIRAGANQKASLLELAVMVLGGPCRHAEVSRQPRSACPQLLVPAAAGDQVHQDRNRSGAQAGMNQQIGTEPPNVPTEGAAAPRQTYPTCHCRSSGAPLFRPSFPLGELEERRNLIPRPATLVDALFRDCRLLRTGYPPHDLQKFERITHSQPHPETDQ